MHADALLSEGSSPVLKFGSASNDVRRLQRALNVATNADLSSLTGSAPDDDRVKSVFCRIL